MSMPTVLIFLMGFSMVGITVMSLTVSTDRNSDRSSSKVQATLLAESGMVDMYDRIRTQMWADGSYPFTISSTNMAANSYTGNRVLGSYTARVISASSSDEDVVVNGTTVRRKTWVFEIGAVGIADKGIRSEINGRFTGTTDFALQRITNVTLVPGASQIFLPSGAIVANSQVNMVTDQGLRVTSPDGVSGHIIGNKGLSWQTQTGSKNTVQHSNVLDAQGLFMVNQASLATTLSPNGIGNHKAYKNYTSPAIVGVEGLPDNPANTVVGLSRDVKFADQATTQTWINNWKQTTAATGANRFMGNLRATDIPERPADSWRVLETPAYIDGDLNVPSNTQLRLMPKSSNPAENVVYVRGDIRNMGNLLNLGAIVVVEGKYLDGPDGLYRLDNQGSPYTDRKTLLQNAAFVSVNPSDDAFKFTSRGSATTGLIYAARGGIEVVGDLTFNGLMLAYKNIYIGPKGGGTFTVNFEPDAAKRGEFYRQPTEQINVTFVPNGVARQFLPSPITNWVQPK